MGDERQADYAQYTGRNSRFGAIKRITEDARQAQAAELARASNRLRAAILSFFASRGPGTEFRADELRIHVAGQCGHVAPDSARRVAASMKPHTVNFECVNRAQSLFRVLPVQPRQPGGTVPC